VLEVAFDAAQLSTRHKSGVAMRFPRIARIRTDKPAEEADRLETLMRLVENTGSSSVSTADGDGQAARAAFAGDAAQ
jgi:DNA ligase-1